MDATRWSAHPAAERPVASAALGAILLAIGGLAWLWSGGSSLFAAISVLLVAGMMVRFLLRTRYEAADEGLRVTFLGRTTLHPWSGFRNLYVHPTGVHLSPFDRPSPLDPFRGVFVLYGRERDRVLAALRARVPQRG